MTARVRIALFSFCVALALATYAGRASAVDSDRLVITDLTTGSVVFDQTTADPAAGGGAEPLLNFGAPLPLPVPPVGGIFALFLTEPAGTVPDPGESPVFLPGTNEIISDIVFSYFQNPSVGQGVTLVSDGDPQFQQWVDSALQLPFHILPESGNLDDVTPLLGGTPNLMIQVQSDAVVPEPGTLLLLGSGLIGIAAVRRRRS